MVYSKVDTGPTTLADYTRLSISSKNCTTSSYSARTDKTSAFFVSRRNPGKNPAGVW
jgi:hypothetical protein